MAFAASSVSERPLHCNVNQGQETPSGNKNQGQSGTHEGAALFRSMSVGRSVRRKMPSPNIGRKLTLLTDPSICIRI
jgi:hypothetical protein